MRPTLSSFSFHVRGRKSGLKKTLVLISCTNSEALVGYWDVEDPVFSGDKPKKTFFISSTIQYHVLSCWNPATFHP